MSHELRTPLNAIAGYTELLELGIHGPLTDAQREALGRIRHSHQHLLTLITNILNFAQLEAGRVQFDVEDLPAASAIERVEELVLPQALARQLKLEVSLDDPTLTVRADPDKLTQILLNLLSNAIKFTDAGGTIQVSGTRGDKRVQFRVHDTGIGIPADRLESIFEPFVQITRQLNRPNEGVGLGLVISRDLARGMGGDIAVESQVDVGSTFTLTLPLASVPV